MWAAGVLGSRFRVCLTAVMDIEKKQQLRKERKILGRSLRFTGIRAMKSVTYETELFMSHEQFQYFLIF